METTQLYNEFIKICDEVIEKVTTQSLIYGALISLSFFLFWAVIAVMSSHVRKFYRKCARLERYLNKHNIGYDNINAIEKYCGNISRGFLHGWNKFLKSKNKKPSEFLTKRDVLDAEVSDGVLNNGKTLMKTYIAITTALLFIFNLAQIGKDLPFAFNILVEAMFLPFVYYVVMIIMYFITNLIKHQEYIIATTHFYTLVDQLDDCFSIDIYVGNNSEKTINFEEEKLENESEEVLEESSNENDENKIEISETTESSAEAVEDVEILKETEDEQTIESVEEPNLNESSEIKNSVGVIDLESFKINDEVSVSEDNFEEIEEEQEIIEPILDDSETQDKIEENEELNQIEESGFAVPVERDWEAEENLDTFDVFKKKNIDVDKYLNEIPNEEVYTTPFIDVNSGVIPTDENLVFNPKEFNSFEEENNLIENQEPLNDSIYDFDEKIEDDEESTNDLSPEIVSLDNNETERIIEESNETDKIETEEVIEENDNDDEITENSIDYNEEIAETSEVVETTENEIVEFDNEEPIEAFDLSQLLNNDENIEENQETDEITEQNEEYDIQVQDEVIDDNTDEFETKENEEIIETAENAVEDESEEISEDNQEAEQKMIDDLSEFDDILKFDDQEADNMNIFEETNSDYQENEFKSKLEQNINESSKEIDSKLENNIELSSIVNEFKKSNQEEKVDDLSEIVGEFKQNFHGDEKVEESKAVNNEDDEKEIEDDETSLASKELVDKINDLENLINSALKKNISSNDNSSKSTKTKRTRKGNSKMENETVKKTRGRPKMKVIDENLVIKTEEEFEEILSRAEKLMRKSESGLSVSQAKRIEKELKIMMDAMNKYKEGGK